jgi:hypothetical protein
MKMSQKKLQKRNSKPSHETLEERVHRHLTDINSKISDEDIRNVKTELDIREETNPGTRRVTGKQKKENKEDFREKYTSPWDLLSEGYD